MIERGNRIRRRIGHRGSILINLGLVWFLIGLSELIITTNNELPLSVLPDWFRAGAWWVTGAVAIAYAFVPRHKSDAVGFIALYIMPAARAASYLWGWINSLDGTGGIETGWLAAALYFGFTALIINCSGWREEQSPDEDREASDS